jgi:hypothetical protein
LWDLEDVFSAEQAAIGMQNILLESKIILGTITSCWCGAGKSESQHLWVRKINNALPEALVFSSFHRGRHDRAAWNNILLFFFFFLFSAVTERKREDTASEGTVYPCHRSSP